LRVRLLRLDLLRVRLVEVRLVEVRLVEGLSVYEVRHVEGWFVIV
jgi:hypothetical protein